MNNIPFFSVIVVALNAEHQIGMTINSILNQSCDDYEIIVKDGVSKDKTLTLVPDNEKIRLYSQKDSSIYDAMNQAISYSRGRYLIFMNCGDLFATPDVLHYMKCFIGNNNYGMVYGNYSRDEILHKQPSVLSRFYMYRTPLCHQTIFFGGSYLRQVYKYDISYRILADYDLELRIMQVLSVAHADILVCSYLGGGVSESPKGIALKKKERKSILCSRFSLKERLIFEMKRQLTFPRLRSKLITSNNLIVKTVYQNLVNHLNH